MNSLSLPDLPGEHYIDVLRRTHVQLEPQSYFEIGTLDGDSLGLAACPSIAVDTSFARVVPNAAIGRKRLCAFYQMPSDRFFEAHDPIAILGRPIDLAFLDGMHLCEFLLRDFANVERYCNRNSIVVLHDCVPVEFGTTARSGMFPQQVLNSSRQGWWLGDVWRTLVTLKRRRLDLKITVLDASPSGLVFVTNLDPTSRILTASYVEIVEEMLSWSLEEIGLAKYQEMLGLISTTAFITAEQMAQRFWL
jgi:hypothetical protein